MPGFTHLQIAQPVTLGHHLLAYEAMFARDAARLSDCRRRVNLLPLGSAALAGTGYPIDRAQVARALGFDGICANSLDAVSDRDFAIEFAAAAALAMVHLSRFAEELILWCSPGFRFVTLADRFCTGSSIMPQKKNPDVPELVRGKTGRVVGALTGLLVLMKGQPLAYNKDNQEDKEPLFDIVDTLADSLALTTDLVASGIAVDAARMRAMAREGFATATDLADYLVRKGMPFRDAHEAVARAVRHAEAKGVDLAELAARGPQVVRRRDRQRRVRGADAGRLGRLAQSSRRHGAGAGPRGGRRGARGAAEALVPRCENTCSGDDLGAGLPGASGGIAHDDRVHSADRAHRADALGARHLVVDVRDLLHRHRAVALVRHPPRRAAADPRQRRHAGIGTRDPVPQVALRPRPAGGAAHCTETRRGPLMDSKNVAFLGLGVMGYPMAGHLAKAGHRVTVYNRSADKAARWVAQHGGKHAATPAAAAGGAELVMMCVGNDDDVRAVALGGDGALAGMRAGAVLVDHTTASASVAREVHAAAKARGVGFLDAPVSGGQAGAENGKLTIMVGGDADVFAQAEAVLAHYARAVTLMGGRGQRTAHQDGQPDLHRRARAGARRGDQLRAARRARRASSCST